MFTLEVPKLLWVAVSKGQGPSQFMSPVYGAFDRRCYLYVSDYLSSRVQVFNYEGKYVWCFSKECSGPGELLDDSDPGAVSLSGQGVSGG